VERRAVVTDHLWAWEELRTPAPETVAVEGAGGAVLRRGSRVRLRPRRGADAFDLVLAGRAATVASIEQDVEGRLLVAVTVDDDPGRDLGALREPGHRFFFAPDELEPLGRVLVAGIGNVFLGDDGFGVALAERLAARGELPGGAEVVDFGIRGMDLAYALLDEDLEAALLLDATPRGGAPGTLYVVEPDVRPQDVGLETHGMDPVKVLGLVHALGGTPPRTVVVGCEPLTRMTGEEDEVVAQLSAPVRAALDEGVRLVEELLADLTAERPSPPQEGAS